MLHNLAGNKETLFRILETTKQEIHDKVINSNEGKPVIIYDEIASEYGQCVALTPQEALDLLDQLTKHRTRLEKWVEEIDHAASPAE